jgi:hypothetical protein
MRRDRDDDGTSPTGLDHIRKTPEQIRDELGVAPVSVEAIRNPAIYDLEREKVFKRVWLKVATAWNCRK